MKFLITFSILLFTFITLPNQAVASDNVALRVCEYVQANDKQRLRKFLKSKKIKIRNIFNDLKCNQDNLLLFAAKANALDVGDFIISKLKSSTVKEQIEALTPHSAHLVASAQARVK